MIISHYIESTIQASIDVKQALLASAECRQAIEAVAELCLKAYRQGNKVVLAGNGGSAADAQHIAAELVARFEIDREALPALALTTDTSAMTAIGNDNGYDHIFARQLLANAVKDDIFIAISTSGNSANIVKAVEAAQKKGVVSVALCGSGGRLVDMCDYSIAVPSACTARIQESHILIGHILCGVIEQGLFSKPL